MYSVPGPDYLFLFLVRDRDIVVGGRATDEYSRAEKSIDTPSHTRSMSYTASFNMPSLTSKAIEMGFVDQALSDDVFYPTGGCP